MSETTLEHLGRIVLIASYAVTIGVWVLFVILKMKKRATGPRLPENSDGLKHR